MNKWTVLKTRLRYSKELNHELLSWKFLWFNYKTSDFFICEDTRLDSIMEEYLVSKQYGRKLEVSDDIKDLIKKNKSYIRHRLTHIYKYVLRIKEEQPITFNLKENSKTIEKLSLRTKALQYMQYYNEALENIVEGQREVLRDKDFKFEDGLTAEQKENKLKDFINKYR